METYVCKYTCACVAHHLSIFIYHHIDDEILASLDYCRAQLGGGQLPSPLDSEEYSNFVLAIFKGNLSL